MSLLMDILGIGASAATGGLFGLAGTVIGRVAGYFETKQKLQFKLQEWAHEEKLFELQSKQRIEETEKEIVLAGVQGSWAGLTASYAADAARKVSYPWVEAVQALVRPVLTVGLVAFLVIRMTTMPPGPELNALIETVAALAGMSVAWWFGDRSPTFATKIASKSVSKK